MINPEQIFAEFEHAKDQRAIDMPTEKDALEHMHRAWLRLKDLGWADAIYSPKDGRDFLVIEAGSTGTFACQYMGKWPTGGWWIHDAGDLWPSRPILWKAKP